MRVYKFNQIPFNAHTPNHNVMCYLSFIKRNTIEFKSVPYFTDTMAKRDNINTESNYNCNWNLITRCSQVSATTNNQRQSRKKREVK